MTALILLACTAKNPVETGSRDSDTGTPWSLDPELAEALQEELERGLEEYGGLGIAMAYKAPGQASWRTAAGIADLETGELLDPASTFRIASITKTFVTTVVLQLVDEGVLGLDDPLAQHADVLSKDTGITLRQLLKHTAGVPDYSIAAEFQAGMADPWTDEALIALIADKELLNDPGTEFHYSNSHFTILALVIQEATEQPWYEHVESRVIQPLGLAETEYRQDAWGDIVPSYVGDADYSDSIHPTAGTAAGGLVSTTWDLALYGEAYGSGALVSSESYDAQLEDPLDIASGIFFFGLGTLMVGDGLEDPSLMVGHNGGLNGACSWMAYRPEVGDTMVLLANRWVPDGASYDKDYPLYLSFDLFDVVDAQR